MLLADLLEIIEQRAPAGLVQSGDNCGLLAGNRTAGVQRILAALELTQAVVEEATAKACDTIITHHPLLFAPLFTLSDEDPRADLLLKLILGGKSLIACHTNVDAAQGGLADIAAKALGLRDTMPLRSASAGWYKLVTFVPPESVEKVAAAVFAAGAGRIGDYDDCAFACEGLGWFAPGPGTHPAIGTQWRPERAREVRWETVVPRANLAQVIAALISAHPYEEPAFDVYPVENVLPRVGLGRVGLLPEPTSVERLCQRAVELFELSVARVVGEDRPVSRVGVLPGSGRGLLGTAAGCCDVLITGDLGYHDAEQALATHMALIDVPHGEFEWWAFSRWARALAEELAASGVELTLSQNWRSPWRIWGPGRPGHPGNEQGTATQKKLRLWIDGGSRGNPGPSALGVVIEDGQGHTLERVKCPLGVRTNNFAEYQALLVALKQAQDLGAEAVEVFSDSELLVKQLKGEYKVRSAVLRPLYVEALRLAGAFRSFSISHVSRDQNQVADKLVNEALDEGG